MAVSDPDAGMHEMFRGLLPEHHVIDLPQDEASTAGLDPLLERHADELAGIIVEPLVQGAGGMRFHDAAVLQRLREAADRYGLLLIFDEIFTGFGRTGTMFACEAAGVVPDIVTLSKALTGGTLPLAATVARKGVRGVLVGRSAAGADARADLHGQSRWPAPPPMPRSICSSASRGCSRSPPLRRAGSASWRRAATCPASRMCGSRARSAWSSWSGSTISTACARGSWRRACSSARSARSSI